MNTLPEACYLFIPCLLANLGAVQRTRKGRWGKHQKFRALQPYIPTGQGGPLKPSALRVENISTTARVLRIPRNRGAHRFYMFSFPDARKAHNRLRWTGKTQKMAGTSGNSFNGSYRVHPLPIDRRTCLTIKNCSIWRQLCCGSMSEFQDFTLFTHTSRAPTEFQMCPSKTKKA